MLLFLKAKTKLKKERSLWDNLIRYFEVFLHSVFSSEEPTEPKDISAKKIFLNPSIPLILPHLNVVYEPHYNCDFVGQIDFLK